MLSCRSQNATPSASASTLGLQSTLFSRGLVSNGNHQGRKLSFMQEMVSDALRIPAEDQRLFILAKLSPHSAHNLVNKPQASRMVRRWSKKSSFYVKLSRQHSTSLVAMEVTYAQRVFQFSQRDPGEMATHCMAQQRCWQGSNAICWTSHNSPLSGPLWSRPREEFLS